MPVRAFGAPQTTCTGSAAGVDDADPQAVGVGVLLRLDDGADHEAVVLAGRVFDRLDLKPDAGQRVDDLGERGRGVEVVFEPGEGEFHCNSAARGSASVHPLNPPASVGMSSGLKP